MAARKNEKWISRRDFLGGMALAPGILLPAPLRALPLSQTIAAAPRALPYFPFADLRFAPHYPAKSTLEDVLRLVAPGSDEFATEKFAAEISELLNQWSSVLKTQPPAAEVIAKFLATRLDFTPLTRAKETTLRSAYGIETVRRQFSGQILHTRELFVSELQAFFATLGQIETADFQIVGIAQNSANPSIIDAQIRYEFAGTRNDGAREQRIATWSTQWSYDEKDGWRALSWRATDEVISRARQPLFIDITAAALGNVDSYHQQLLHGVDHWRTVLDAASGIDVYGNNGIAVGDFDGDGFDDLYICQPAGLPNRLYRNRGDGTFEDVTAPAGVDVLDATACALFADFENKGLQDLLVVTASGPLLFLNQGKGKFALKRDAFHFAQPPQGTFTHAALADYDHDGRLDIYFCLYSYYLGLDQYHYPAPYFDARNGPPNFLLHNEGNATFRDRTAEAGLNADNDRYSFACAWADYDGSGHPSLYVANDFGRSNLYRNNGDGTFTSVAAQAAVEDPGAGMSACWCDFENRAKQDIYVANMWSAAGLRVSNQPAFQPSAPQDVRAFYRQHARGNSLYRNLGNGKFQNVAQQAGVALGRWAWCSDAWDFDHDGHSDLYIVNGYISGPDSLDLASFFWRQVVGKSPQTAVSSAHYEQGWNAINELIRSDSSWNGRERNVFYANNGDGSFSNISAVAGLDLLDDSRAFALADLDQDGRLEVILKNRTSPQIRILRNAMTDIGNRIAVCLHGEKSNRDAIGAAVTVEAGSLRQTKYLQAGSGFLAQHTKEICFGVGKNEAPVRLSIRWPNGSTQAFDRVPINHKIEISEGSPEFLAKPFSPTSSTFTQAGAATAAPTSPASTETWLLEPLPAPEFSLPDQTGKPVALSDFQGTPLLLTFLSPAWPESHLQLKSLQQNYSSIASSVRILVVSLDEEEHAQASAAFVASQNFAFPVLRAAPEVAGVYNIIFRYLFDRRRDLSLPTSFLLDSRGHIVKLHQGIATRDALLRDVAIIPSTEADRLRLALPFPGTLHNGPFERNDFTYGVALFQRGYLDQAAASFRQVIAAKPHEPDAYYNLGTLYLRQNNFTEARNYLEQAVKLRPNYPEAFNNLGMIAAQQNQTDDAVRNFQRSLELRPDYATALLNLGNLYRRQGDFSEAEKLLRRALQLDPENPEVPYNLGMLYARQEQLPLAAQFLQKAVQLRPDYPDALNNLGVFFVREQRYPEAEDKFKTCIRVAPQFDQAYMNLARLYVILQQKEKARETLQALLQQQPDHKMAQQALEMLN